MATWGAHKCLMVLGLFLIMMTELGILKAFTVLVNDMMVDLQISMSFFGMVIGLCHALSIAFGIIHLPLLRRFSYRQLIATGGLISSICFTAVSFTKTGAQLALCFIVASLGNSIVCMPSHTVASVYFPNAFEIVTGIIYAGSGVGMMTLPALADILNDIYGWRGATVLLGACNFHVALGGVILSPITSSESSESLVSPENSETIPLTLAEETFLLVGGDNPNQVKTGQNSLGRESAGPESRGPDDTRRDSSSLDITGRDITDLDGTCRNKESHEPNFFTKLAKYLDLVIIHEYPIVLVGLVLYFLYHFISVTWYVFVVPNAIAKGIAPKNAVVVAVVGGVANTIGRLTIGIVSTFKFVGDDVLLCALNISSAVAFICNIVAATLLSLSAIVAVTGFCLGALSTLLSIFLRSIVPANRFPAAITLVCFLPAFGEVFGGSLMGYLYDMTSSFDLSYVIVGLMHLIFIMVAMVPRTLRHLKLYSDRDSKT